MHGRNSDNPYTSKKGKQCHLMNLETFYEIQSAHLKKRKT
jgi:hypothetical protein